MKHQAKTIPKLPSSSFPDDLNISDPFNMASWQFNSSKGNALYQRNLTEETLLSTGTPTSGIIDIGAASHELTPKLPEVLEGPVLKGVYTLPEEPENEENEEENTEM